MTSEINILPADTFTVISKNVFSQHDQEIITMLYQPIIGSLSTGLYFTLMNYINSKEVNHYHLMMSTKLNLDIIIDARKKLEGIGLLKTYYSKQDGLNKFVYELYSPLSVLEFASSPLLSTLLINNIGKKDYEEILFKFKTSDLDITNYKDITSSFNKIFRLENIDASDNLEISLEKKVKNEVNVKSNINFNELFTLIPDDLLNKKTITKDMINFINNTAYVYNLDEEALREIISNSINISHKLDKEQFKNNCENYYRFNNNGKVTNVVYQKQPESLKTKNLDTSNKSKLIYSLENVSPYDFLASKYNSGVPSKSDLKLIEYLLVDLKMKPGVINVLIDYVLKTNENKLTKGYVDAVASQWMKSNIEDVKGALEIAKKEYSNKKKLSNKVKKNESPKWMNESVESSIATKEEQEEMEKMIKDLVGEK